MNKQYTSLKMIKNIFLFLFLITYSKTSSAQQSAGCHAGFTFVVSGNTVTFNDTSFFDVGPQNTTWLWNFGDGSTDITQSPIHTFTTPPDQYTVCLVVTNCAILPGTCCTDSVCHLIEFEDPTGIAYSSLTGANVSIFPNPVSKKFSLGFNLREAATLVLRIYDATGRACYPGEAMRFSAGNQRIDFDESILPAKGFYFLQISKNAEPSAILKFAKL